MGLNGAKHENGYVLDRQILIAELVAEMQKKDVYVKYSIKFG